MGVNKRLQYKSNMLVLSTTLAIIGSLVSAAIWLQKPLHAMPAKTQSWQVVTSPNPGTGNNMLNGVAALANNDIWAAGSTSGNNITAPLIEHYDGNTWSVSPNPATAIAQSTQGDDELNAISAMSNNDIWAVGMSDGGQQTLLEHYNGSQWSIAPSPAQAKDGDLFGVAAIAANNVWAVGRDNQAGSLIIHYDGNKWSTVTSQSPGNTTNILFGITAASATDIWAVGQEIDNSQAYTLTEHYNGSTWSIMQDQQTSGDVQFNSAAALPAGGIVAVGRIDMNTGANRTFAETWNGTAWSTLKPVSPVQGTCYFTSAIATTTGTVWAVGNAQSLTTHTKTMQTIIEKWDGKTWTLVNSPSLGTGVMLNSIVAIPNSPHLLAVGAYQTDPSTPFKTLIENF